MFANSKPNCEELVGVFAHVRFFARDTGYIVGDLEGVDGNDGQIVCGQADEGELVSGLTYRFMGRWRTHHKYGRQFEFSTFVKDEPHTQAGVERYLIEIAPNVGRQTARRLWQLFGSNAVAVLRTHPEQVAAAGLLTDAQAREAAAELENVRHLEKTKIDLMDLFTGRGFPKSLIHACMDRWGARAASNIRKNPFRLLASKLPGCGFRRVDRLYLDLGYKPNRVKRQMFAIWNAIRTAGSGHTWVPMFKVTEELSKSLGSAVPKAELAVELGKRARWLATRWDEQEKTWVADWKAARDEHTVAEKINQLLGGQHAWPACSECANSGLTDHQLENLEAATLRPIGILAGTPGTGKTFTAAALIKAIIAKHGIREIAVAAPTGKAAVRITADLKKNRLDIEASTIHRLLGVSRNGHDQEGWAFQHNASNPLSVRYLVIDEASMLDTSLAASLLSACGPNTHVLFVCDPYQLSPVGHGAPLRDFIFAGIPCGELTEIHRNAGYIVRACAAIKAGAPFVTCDKYVPEAGENFRHIECFTPENQIETLKAVLAGLNTSKRFDPINDVQVLVTVNKKSLVSREYLNKVLQNVLNPSGRRVRGNPFKVGDKIIGLRNRFLPVVKMIGNEWRDVKNDQYESVNAFVANGDMGRVVDVTPATTIARFVYPARTVRIPMGKASEEEKENADKEQGEGADYSLGFAITVHKSQGSQAPMIIYMIDDYPGAAMVASRESAYTAISRAEKFCLTIGRRETLNRQCQRKTLENRKTFLRELLQVHCEAGAK
jgi:exodeoxyribonuclease V alpha subunit